MPEKKSKVIGQDDKEESLIKGEWRDFSKTLAFKQLMEYAGSNQVMLERYAKDMSMPGPNGGPISLDVEKAMSLLQRSAGIDIMTSYIRLYVE